MAQFDPYATTRATGQFDPYSTLRTEPNMRTEMTNTLNGSYPEIAKGHYFVLRKMRTSSGEFVACPCVDSVTGEPDRDYYCPICLGVGKLWDETLVVGYKQVIRSSVGLATKENLIGPGNVNLHYVSFFFEYDLDLNVTPKHTSPDKIIEVMTDDAGDPIRPYERQRIYGIGTAIDFRSDNGKLEYWKLDCFEEQTKFLNGAGG